MARTLKWNFDRTLSNHMATPERNEFIKHLNTAFRAEQTEASVDLQLIEVSDLRRFPGQENFSLIFKGPRNLFLAQGTNSFHHEALGDFDMFTVPIREDSNSFYYEAVFNRLTPEDANS